MKMRIQFHIIEIKMPKSQLQVGLETSIKHWQSSERQHLFSVKRVQLGVTLAPYRIWFCENVDNYGWPLNVIIIEYRKTIGVLR